MNTFIMSAFEAVSSKHFLPKTIIIRIASRSHQPLQGKLQDELRLIFDDIQDRDLRELKDGTSNKKPFTEEHIKEIISFLEKNKDAENLICQCEAGVSRSAGLAIGLNQSYFKNKPELRKLRKIEGKRPNRHVRYQLSQFFK